jgi:predicted lysophospholipase L1 biosynthesis ABC-type transport system permease subunit
VISEALARHYWPNEDPIGKAIGNSSRPPFYRVAGVAGDVHSAGLDQAAPEVIYYPLIPITGSFLWSPPNQMAVVVRTRSDHPAALTESIRRVLNDLDRNVPMANVEPLVAVVSRSMARVAFATLLLGIAAGMALLLSAIGVFGAIAFVVSQRRREIGVRIALGAEPSGVSARIVVQALRLGALGLVIGIAAALATTRLLRSLLIGVAPSDPLSLVLVSVVLLGVVALASYLPAHRAARVSPVEALRAE